jgi:hypothetical protein
MVRRYIGDSVEELKTFPTGGSRTRDERFADL